MDPQDIRWFRARLQAYRYGLLDERAERRFEGLRDKNSLCRGSWEAYLEEESGAEPLAEHIPVDLLADWKRAERELRGLERSLLREHLEACEQCRRDLVELGHSGELSEEPAEEPRAGREPGGARVLKFAAEPAGDRQPPPGYWTRLTTAWAGVATVAAVLLFLLRGDVFEPAGPGLAPVPFHVPQTRLRGPEGRIPELHVRGEEGKFHLLLDGVRWTAGDQLRVSIYDAADSLLQQTTVDRGASAGEHVLLSCRNRPPVPEGVYRVELLPLRKGAANELGLEERYFELVYE